jgi:hypothetical protein
LPRVNAEVLWLYLFDALFDQPLPRWFYKVSPRLSLLEKIIEWPMQTHNRCPSSVLNFLSGQFAVQIEDTTRPKHGQRLEYVMAT